MDCLWCCVVLCWEQILLVGLNLQKLGEFSETEDLLASVIMFIVLACLIALIIYHVFVYARKYVRASQREKALREAEINNPTARNPLNSFTLRPTRDSQSGGGSQSGDTPPNFKISVISDSALSGNNTKSGVPGSITGDSMLITNIGPHNGGDFAQARARIASAEALSLLSTSVSGSGSNRRPSAESMSAAASPSNQLEMIELAPVTPAATASQPSPTPSVGSLIAPVPESPAINSAHALLPITAFAAPSDVSSSPNTPAPLLPVPTLAVLSDVNTTTPVGGGDANTTLSIGSSSSPSPAANESLPLTVLAPPSIELSSVAPILPVPPQLAPAPAPAPAMTGAEPTPAAASGEQPLLAPPILPVAGSTDGSGGDAHTPKAI